RHARGDGDGVELGVVQQIVEGGREAGLRVLGRVTGAVLVGEIAAPCEVRHPSHVAHDVRAPVAQADDADADAHSLTTLPLAVPADPVALRKSTTSRARCTT